MTKKLSNCETCGKEVAKSANRCPHCGAKLKMGCFMKLIVGIGILFVVFVMNLGDDAKNKSNESSLSSKNKTEIKIPTIQKQMSESVVSFYSDYRSASNELKKSNVRRKRKEKLKQIMKSLIIKNWIGKLDSLQTNSEGKAYISIKPIGADFEIKTWNNALSDIFSNTLIEANSKIYTNISELSEGDTVLFSGSFFSSDLDHIKETSMSESGAMTDPEFLFKFSSVIKYSK
jgi:hypothetical protein